MLYTKTMLRACAVSLIALSLLTLALWSTGNYPPVALANGGGGGTMYTLSKCTPTNGTISNSPTGTVFASGTVVTLTATPSAGYQFAGWSGSISGLTNPIQLPMNSNKSVCATFTKIQRTLTVQKGTSCTGTPSPGVGPHAYDHGTSVTVFTTGNFDSWSGSGVPSGQEENNPITVVMDADKTVTAHYKKVQLTMAVTGGTGADSSPSVGGHLVCLGDDVSISATPAAGFSHWEGDVDDPDSASTTVMMDVAKTVTAVFDNVTLTMDKTGGVTGSSVSPMGTHTYARGARVNISATPSELFVGWTGDHVGTSASDSFVIEGDTEVTGVFSAKTLTATLDADGCESCTVEPESRLYRENELATITATADEGWVFLRWEGDVPGGKEEDNPLDVTMNQDRYLEAILRREFVLTMNVVGLESFSQSQIAAVVDPDPGNHGFLDDPSGAPYPTAIIEMDGAPQGYQWLGWSGDENGLQTTKSIALNEDKNVTANFAPEGAVYTILLTSDPLVGGTVYGAGDFPVAISTQVSATANSANGYSFSRWADPNGNYVSDSNPLTVGPLPAESATQLIAVFDISCPDGETTTAHGWNLTFARFKGTLGGSANYEGLTVTELDGGAGLDMCWWFGSAYNRWEDITGGSWTVGSDNKWEYDYIGWSSQLIDYYRNHHRAPCSARIKQDMRLNQTNCIYKSNTLLAYIDWQDIVSVRDGVSQNTNYP